MSLKQIMSVPVFTVNIEDNLQQIKELFSDSYFHHLLVIDHKKLCGIISDRDYLKEINPRLGTPAEKAIDTLILNKRAHQIMSRKPISLKENDSIHAAINIFNEHKISCIPIVNDLNEPIGVISWRDILQAIKIK